jgi:ribonuclease R
MKKQRKAKLKKIAAKAKHKYKHKNQHKKSAGRRHQETISGTITITPSGFGFVAPDYENQEEKPQDIFIPPKYVKSAMDGDKVEVVLLPPRDDFYHKDKGPVGKIVEIVERSKDTIVGELISGRKVRPLNKRIPEDIKITGSLCGAKRGEWVEVKLLHTESLRERVKQGTVASKIGEAGLINNDLDAVCKEFKLCPPYSEQEDQDAAVLKPRKIKRQDLRKLFCVTIDPIDAKDFDDAISLAPAEDENEVEIGVHIADVAAWIAPGSKFDKSAAERGFTAYLPGRTLPMLPKTLTAEISLTADNDSPAHTVIMTVNRQSGRITSSRRCHSTIRVKKRLTFDQVQDFIDSGDAPDDWDKDFQKRITELIQIYRNMREFRKRNEKFLEMSIPESRILCDEEKNEIIGLVRKEQREADQLVEECMLAANTEVAKEMIERGIAGIYRVHPEPDPEKLEEFTALCADSFGIMPGDLTSRTACNHFLENLPDGPKRPAILSAFLRSLPRAYYLESSELHFGLGKTRYSHFTSPIRRYTDLIVHQQLWDAETGGRLKSKKTIAQIAADCSSKEENNDDAYFTANDRLKLRYLQQEMDNGLENLHEGVISKITSSGLVVDIQDIGIYGFVPVETLPGGFSRYGNVMRDRRGKKTYKSGDYIYLKLSQIDFIRGSALFKPA